MKSKLHTVALAICLVVIPLASATAQEARYSKVPSGIDEDSRSGKTIVADRLARDLRSDDVKAREGALSETAYYAHFGTRNVDLSPTLPALLKIYRSDDDEQRRIMAVSILDAIGDQETMNELYVYAKHERSPRVQMVTLAVLRNHLGISAFKGDKEMGAIASEVIEWRQEMKEGWYAAKN